MVNVLTINFNKNCDQISFIKIYSFNELKKAPNLIDAFKNYQVHNILLITVSV
ncbi:hypothetical protein P278_02120 [Zhouia amylolytica AD3]|uniref:Uncharacterized protein n=1 Tax=Zhouia amylolytica AD3 TaxID=1286632 RepID=W2UTF6_9FLAO|nr:hypothetical protein P278_02120 [Zhouia amylolytica AD3]